MANPAGRLAGYEDVNDAERLRHDPAMRWIVGGALCADKPASWAMTGRIRSARAAALRSDPAVQPPSFAPRRLAAARPSLVRCEMSARSFCASAANRRRTKGSTSARSSVTTNGRT